MAAKSKRSRHGAQKAEAARIAADVYRAPRHRAPSPIGGKDENGVRRPRASWGVNGREEPDPQSAIYHQARDARIMRVGGVRKLTVRIPSHAGWNEDGEETFGWSDRV
jgi:hypothetical protein